MSSLLESILKNFEQVEKAGSKYPKFGKAGKTDYIFTCKRCGNQTEPIHFDLDIKYRLVSHLVKNCSNKPVSSSSSEQQDQEGPGPARAAGE